MLLILFLVFFEVVFFMEANSFVEELRVRKIRDGTVIDHLPGNTALRILNLLGLPQKDTLSVLINVDSEKLEKKDLIKIENRYLTEDEIAVLGFIAPNSTINFVKNYAVISKKKPGLPETLRNVKCPNPICISNDPEPARPLLTLKEKEKESYRCKYCGRVFSREEIENAIFG